MSGLDRALRDLQVAEAIELLGIAELAAKVGHLADLIINLKETLVATVDQLVADFTAYQGDVTNTLDALRGNVSDLTATVADLRNQLANVVIPPEAQATIDSLDQQVQAADANLQAAPTPAPVEPPAPTA